MKRIDWPTWLFAAACIAITFIWVTFLARLLEQLP